MQKKTVPRQAKDLVRYIIGQYPKIGKVKLMKILYLIDFTAYEKLGHSITNDRYLHWRLGPVPETIFNHYEELRNVSLVDTLTLTPEEQDVVHSILTVYGTISSDELVNMVHREMPYRITAPQQEIPYFLAPYRNHCPFTDSELDILRADTQFMQQINSCFS